MITKRAYIILIGILLPWFFLIVVVPLSALMVFRTVSRYLGSVAQIIGYFVALIVFIIFLLLWYFLTTRYVYSLLKKYEGVSKNEHT